MVLVNCDVTPTLRIKLAVRTLNHADSDTITNKCFFCLKSIVKGETFAEFVSVPRKATKGVGTMVPLVEKMWGHFFILRAIKFSVGAIILYLLCFITTKTN